ncbi:Peptidase A5, thermopsin, partial [mine drainage metagenome]
MALRAIELANQSNTPLKDVFLPNFASVSGIKAGHITLGYSQSPAPMGIGFYGLYNNSGTTEANNYTFPDLAAHVNLTQLQTMYLADGAPQDVSFQLNAVLSNVNLFGNSSYALWTQNVIFYS